VFADTAIFFIGIDVLTIELAGYEGNGSGKFLDLCLHQRYFVLCLDVGCCVSCVGHACTGKLFDVLVDIVAIVCHLIGGFLPVASCCSAICVLLVGVGGFDDCLKMRLGKGEVHFGD
jgi:hypothetical protein